VLKNNHVKKGGNSMPHMGANELKQLGIGKKIRALREGKGLMLDDLAARAGLTKVLLGQIEEDVVPPTVATLLNLSKLLDVSIDYFFTEDEHIGRVEVTRIDERLTVHHDDLPDAGQVTYNYESLAYRLAKKHMEPFYVEFDSTEEPSSPFTHDGEEFIFVMDGEIEVAINGDTFTLHKGDSIYFFANVPHTIRGIGPNKPKALIVLYPYNQ